MTKQLSPITPPPELVAKWASSMCGYYEAAQWGADQELDACCADIHTVYGRGQADWLRSMRRPKPPSLKEQALVLLDDASDRLDAVHENIIRRALEALDD